MEQEKIILKQNDLLTIFMANNVHLFVPPKYWNKSWLKSKKLLWTMPSYFNRKAKNPCNLQNFHSQSCRMTDWRWPEGWRDLDLEPMTFHLLNLVSMAPDFSQSRTVTWLTLLSKQSRFPLSLWGEFPWLLPTMDVCTDCWRSLLRKQNNKILASIFGNSIKFWAIVERAC
jgi:hypothetical protein